MQQTSGTNLKKGRSDDSRTVTLDVDSSGEAGAAARTKEAEVIA